MRWRRELGSKLVADELERLASKYGLTVYGEDRGFAEGRGAEVEEWLLVRHTQ